MPPVWGPSPAGGESMARGFAVQIMVFFRIYYGRGCINGIPRDPTATVLAMILFSSHLCRYLLTHNLVQVQLLTVHPINITPEYIIQQWPSQSDMYRIVLTVVIRPTSACIQLETNSSLPAVMFDMYVWSMYRTYVPIDMGRERRATIEGRLFGQHVF